MKVAAIILAAGAASRIGKAKMLLPFNQTNILAHIVSAFEDASVNPIYIVTGYYHQEIITTLTNTTASIVFNQDWELGMSSSIQKGLHELLMNEPDITKVIIAVSDQPFLNKQIIDALITEGSLTGKPIVAATYKGVVGTPVLFEKAYFTQLLNLSGDKGARAILQQFPDYVATIPFNQGALDIDTQEDYEQFCSILNNVHVD